MVAAVLSAATLAAAPRPDLVEAAVVAAPSRIRAGETLHVMDVMLNQGDAQARASATGIYVASMRVGSPATDDVARQSAIVYDVYEASAPGGEGFTSPTYTSAPGATSFVTPPLPDTTGYVFVVRARDPSGNRDANDVERAGRNLCY